MSFAGGKSYAKRRAHYDVPEDHHNVQDDIATLSYYNRARAVANGQEPGPEPSGKTYSLSLELLLKHLFLTFVYIFKKKAKQENKEKGLLKSCFHCSYDKKIASIQIDDRNSE